MVRAWLLFGVLALASGQIIYPDQYDKMTVDLGVGRASIPNGSPALQAASNSQPVQVDHQFNGEPAPQFDAAGSAKGQFYPTTTARVPLYSSVNPTPSPQPMPWGNHVNDIISRGITKFALDLDRTISKTSGTSVTNQPENVVFSPLSVSVALSLVLLGSSGKTFEEITRMLGLETGVDISQHSEIVHQMFGQLLAIMNYRVEGSNLPRVNSASGVFVQQGYPIRPEFRAISENAYNSEVINLDFQTKGREARDTINAWVKQQTMNKIDSILSQQPDPLTTVILVSALYFKGEWDKHFIGTMTRRKQFFIEPNDTSKVVEIDMMYNGGNFPFYEDKSLGVKILALPYKGLETSMYVLQPKAEGAAALKSFQEQLTPETIEYLISNLKNETCIVGFPRMKLSSTLNLNGVLYSLGLHSLFDPKDADLSLLSNGFGQPPLPPIVPLPQALPTSIPQALPTSIPQALPTSIPQALPTINLQPFPTVPKALPTSIPQPFPTSIPQPFPTSIPQPFPTSIPQPFPTSIPQPFPTSIPQPFPTSIPKALPQMPRQIPPGQLPNSKTDELLIFSRFGNNNSQGATNGVRRNYFAYDDKRHGVSVEQWDTGFNIRPIDRARRDAGNEGRDGTKSSRVTYVTENGDLEKVPPKAGDASTRYKEENLEENKYRFRNAERNSRRKRQSRPIDERFVKFMQTQSFPFYGLDNLRNSAGLVNPGLYATDVLHKVEMDVTEKGTEAAAATAVLLRRDGNQKKLLANRPFTFFIRHDPTKLILFWGTVNVPTPSYAVR
ncbi:PREDICTED: uncharacterized protein LOC105557169 isoform X2 [Vollenhovia emeryi]|uniref:uncharacterized protein LOC105557169 isoform X2 n=1 Tax=Vollenhovia emeryi TaxID=411798 RepID=UPI0005F3787F|nr:PREDICTED: uncharacterized protein LOC105557169 isoform X2 [Vollenhovia emeryi]